MTRVLALDPGLRNPAIAFHDGERITVARRIALPSNFTALETLDRCEQIADRITCFANVQLARPDVIVVEWPQWYSETKSEGRDPNDLGPLCGIAGAMIAHMRRLWDSTREHIAVKSPRPREVWGNLPKATGGDPWESPRGRRLASRLTAAEREVVQDKHDALDAAGLALWGAGLWAPRRVFPGAV